MENSCGINVKLSSTQQKSTRRFSFFSCSAKTQPDHSNSNLDDKKRFGNDKASVTVRLWKTQ